MAAPSSQFASLQEAVATASYVEQLLNTEIQWIINRVSWLFVAESFLVAAFVVLVTSTAPPHAMRVVQGLTWAIPLIGLTCSTAVGLSVIAAEHEATALANERARLSDYINKHCPSTIPLIGVSEGLRDTRWTHVIGSAPHRILPWLLTVFWVIFLVIPSC